MALNPILLGAAWFIIHRYSVFHTFIWRGWVGGLSQMKLTSFEKNCKCLPPAYVNIDISVFRLIFLTASLESCTNCQICNGPVSPCVLRELNSPSVTTPIE